MQSVKSEAPSIRPAERPTSTRLGVACGAGAYLIWGLIPLYFQQVSRIPPLSILAHRIVWSVVFFGILMVLQGVGSEVLACFRSPRLLLALLGSTIAVAVNWFTFIYAISHDRILQASLGYFVTPLFNVAMGVILLGERLRRWQLVGLILAAFGVSVQMIGTWRLPWIALLLAASFSTYGLLRKRMSVGPLVGGMVETTLLLPFGIIVAAMQTQRDLAHGAVDAHTYLFLPFSGVVTAVPLLLFARAARTLRLTTIGFLQYLAPTGHFLIGLASHEELTRQNTVSFVLIWIALLIYSIDAWRANSERRTEAGRQTAPPTLSHCAAPPQ
jgi:chloramphenicol-sensitive protein RarD